MSYTRKDLILLHKYKDESYKKALVDRVVSSAKTEVLRVAMMGDTIARISATWASTKDEMESLKKEEALVLEQVNAVFKDARVDIMTNCVSFIVYEFWEIVVKVDWS
jgi:hypothetical protein